jgi:hypothetical protein
MTMNTMPTPISSHAAFAAGNSSSSDQSDQEAVLSLPARLVPGLPVPLTLRLRVPGAPVPVCIWTGTAAAGARAPVLADTIVFDGAELAALAVAAEADRVWHPEFLGLCFEKWRRPDTRVSEAELLAGANPDPEVSWSLERLLRRLGIELLGVELEIAPIVRPLHVAA